MNQMSIPVKGFSHWSGLLINGHYIAADSLKCPATSKGGLPPVNTEKENLENGQKCMVEGVIDNQAERCAFTVNEALCARNRFVNGFEGALKSSRLVKPDVVTLTGNTILVTEWVADWRIVSDIGNGFSKSYMPVHGFKGIGKMWPDRYDLNMVDDTAVRSCGAYGAYVRATSDDVSTAPNINRSYPSRLDWVGRNHGSRISRKSNFFYVDGHIETKTVYKTIWNNDFEWGHSVYSIAGNNGVNQF
jgi:prepilin-type processing-associated H-X9-DG protein